MLIIIVKHLPAYKPGVITLNWDLMLITEQCLYSAMLINRCIHQLCKTCKHPTNLPLPEQPGYKLDIEIIESF